jgi:hypothetical protein
MDRHSGLLPLVSALTPGNFDPMQVLSPATLALRAANTLVGGPAPDVLRVPPPVESILVHGVHTISPPGPPGVTSVTPTSDRAAGGTPVTPRGTGFTGATPDEFGTAIATDVRVHNDTTMRVTQSGRRRTGRRGCDLASRSVDSTQRVQVRAASHGSRSELRVEREQHSRTDLRPRLYRGHRVTIGTVTLSRPSHVFFHSDSLIVAIIPARAAGTVDVQVATPGGTSRVTLADQFTYVSAPVVTGISPRSASAGTGLTISGTGLSGATAVRFAGHLLTQIDVVSDTTIHVITPSRSGSVLERHRGHAIWPRRGSARLFHLQLIDARTEHRYDLQDATNDRPHLAAVRP